MRSNPTVLGRVALPGEPLVEHQVVLLRFAGELTPDDERPAAIGRGAGDGAEPVRAVCFPLEAALHPQALLAVALERGAESLGRSDALDREADQPVEGLQQIDVDLAALIRTGPLDLELIGRGVGESLHVEQRLAAARLDIEHVTQDVLLPEAVRALRFGSLEQLFLLVRATGLQIVEGVFVGLKTDNLDDTRAMPGLIRCRKTLGLAVVPLRSERNLLDAW